MVRMMVTDEEVRVIRRALEEFTLEHRRVYNQRGINALIKRDLDTAHEILYNLACLRRDAG